MSFEPSVLCADALSEPVTPEQRGKSSDDEGNRRITKIERQLGERFKNGSVDGTVVSIWPGLGEFDVRADDGKIHKFIGDENDYDRCEGCGQIDPRTHRWFFARALRAEEINSLAIADALDYLNEQMADHVRRYEVDGRAEVSAVPEMGRGYSIFRGTVTPRLLCDKATR